MKAWLRRAGLAGLLSGALLPASGTLRAQEPWTALGPTGDTGNAGIAGRVISLAVDPRDPNRVFAGSASGGLWVSELTGNQYDCCDLVRLQGIAPFCEHKAQDRAACTKKEGQ